MYILLISHFYDSISNGILYAPKVYRWLVPDNGDVSREEANHLVQETDDDHDELLRYRVWFPKLQLYFWFKFDSVPLLKSLVYKTFRKHCFTVSMRSLLIMRYLLDQKQLISANIWPYNKWNDSKKNCKTIIELYIAFRKIIENDSNITLCMEYVLVSIKCQPHYNLTT